MTPELRSETATLLEGHHATVALTLVWNDPRISLNDMQRVLHSLHARVDRQLLGRGFNRAPAADRSHGWAVAEDVGTNPHLHIGWKLPEGGDEILRGVLLKAWPKFAPRGNFDIQPYTFGWAGYATKALPESDHVFLY
jgi:hypothetical protein